MCLKKKHTHPHTQLAQKSMQKGFYFYITFGILMYIHEHCYLFSKSAAESSDRAFPPSAECAEPIDPSRNENFTHNLPESRYICN